MFDRIAAWAYVALTLSVFLPGLSFAQAAESAPVWHPREFRFRTGERAPGGAPLTEADLEPHNPWLNWRLSARLRSPRGRVLEVPGFYAGNGNGNGAGGVWKVRFAPDEPGLWSLTPTFEYASFPINVEPLGVAGERSVPLQPRVFNVSERSPSAPGFLRSGQLEYVGEHYLKFRDGSFFLKGGTDSPENFFGYAGFDDPFDSGGQPPSISFLHEYPTHRADWNPGDPDWSANGTPNAGRGIIGALNYLSAQGVNSIYFLPNNLGGDGRDTFPFLSPAGGYVNNTHWDVSRMEQWNTTLEHATRKGILVQFVLAEEESGSVNWLSTVFGPERKLFFKNLVAMFGHNPALKFNFCEENSADPGDEFSVAELHAFADYLAMWDAYGHPLTVHTTADTLELYNQVLTTNSSRWLNITSLQLHGDYGEQVEAARRLSFLNGGEPIVVDEDEQGSPSEGLADDNADSRRKEVLYDVYLSGGNLEWYFGLHSLPVGGDVRTEDFRTREEMWTYMRYARQLLSRFPFWEMEPDDGLVSGEKISSLYGGAEVFAKRGSFYIVYYPRALSTGALDLRHVPLGQTLSGAWFNPRAGRTEGPTLSVPTGAFFPVPPPPREPTEDWVFVVRPPV